MSFNSDHYHHLHHHHHQDDVSGLSPHHYHHNLLNGNCGDNTTLTMADPLHNIDLVTTLRSELAALSYKKERLTCEMADLKANFSIKDTECENLRAQVARQSALTSSLQNRLQTAENREHSIQSRCDTTIQTIQREKRCSDEKIKQLLGKIKHLEDQLSNEEDQNKQINSQLNDFLRRLGVCLVMQACENVHLTTECVVTRAEEVMTELHRTKAKLNSTCDTLSSCENELLNLKSLSNVEKQRLSAQLESVSNHEHELEARCRQYERDLQLQRDRLSESEISTEKLKDEIRGFESRCHRLQADLNRVQNDRLEFLRCLSNYLNLTEPCESLIKDKLRELLSETKNMHEEIHNLRNQISYNNLKLRETQENTQSRLRNEEAQKSQLKERLEKCHGEIHSLRKDHVCLSDYLQRLARALQWSECFSPTALGNNTNILAENLLEKVEHLATAMEDHNHHGSGKFQHHHHNHHQCSADKSCCDHNHHNRSKLRREKSCHDMPLKDSTSTLYNLQRKVRVLKEQVQRKDLHLELLKRKLAIIEDGTRGKCMLQREREEAICRAKKANKVIDKLTAQLADSRSQIAEAKAQLTEAVEYKIKALERARKIDDLTAQICDLEEEKTRLLLQVSTLKERLKFSSDSNQNRRCRDETLINSLRDDLGHLRNQLSDANHRLSHLQSFRTSVARTLHLRDLPETDLLQRLQALCSAHQEFTMLSKRYETASPVGDHPCPRYNDPIPPSKQCQPPRYSITPELISASANNHDYEHSHSHNHNLRHGHHCP